MEATFSFETSVEFQRTTRRYIPEDRTVYIESVRGSYEQYCNTRTRQIHVTKLRRFAYMRRELRTRED
jgi:hypothetical protein